MIRQLQKNAFECSEEAPALTSENYEEYITKFNAWLETDPDVQLYFDYVEGHVIKCDISGDEFDERLYDRDCGEGRAAEVIEALRNGTEISDKMSESDDFIRCMLDLVKADYDAKHGGEIK